MRDAHGADSSGCIARRPFYHGAAGLARFLVAVLLGLGFAAAPAPGQTVFSNVELLDIMVKAYPEFLERHEDGLLIWKDGTRMPFDDGIANKDFATRLDKPSLKDQFYAPYPLTSAAQSPEVDIDPGRVRFEPLFAKMYGDCRKREVEGNLVEIVWLPKKSGKKIKVSKVNGVAAALERISAELDELPAAFDKYLWPPAGTYNCRPIAGTQRLSAHGAGIAIDISTRHAHYWYWARKAGAGRISYQNEIPPEIVVIFEQHGFIWGGKWYHFDTMHFEYRPEIIAAGVK